jgi:hypothetical protein
MFSAVLQVRDILVGSRSADPYLLLTDLGLDPAIFVSGHGN